MSFAHVSRNCRFGLTHFIISFDRTKPKPQSVKQPINSNHCDGRQTKRKINFHPVGEMKHIVVETCTPKRIKIHLLLCIIYRRATYRYICINDHIINRPLVSYFQRTNPCWRRKIQPLTYAQSSQARNRRNVLFHF